ncbi:hypothetical protein ACIF8Z_10340 [Pseudomonas promysalinigenes]|uniref:hypothetical protein n=1 Tax=Pseudomonas TaxID=286 RepID=UPI001F20BBB6|nr:hypothetical protein [Pseudomonas juntendi]
MSTDKHERQFLAYQALKDLSDVAADTMKMIAYERMEHIDWDETCRRHREAFSRWIDIAEGQKLASEESASGPVHSSELIQPFGNK